MFRQSVELSPFHELNHSVCGVCGIVDDNKTLIQCHGICKHTRVHPGCVKSLDFNNWQCAACKYVLEHRTRGARHCLVCPHPFGPMNVHSTGSFIHYACEKYKNEAIYSGTCLYCHLNNQTRLLPQGYHVLCGIQHGANFADANGVDDKQVAQTLLELYNQCNKVNLI